MTEILNELAVIEAPMSEEDKVVHLLTSLPESYDTLVTALEANEKVPSMEVVIDCLIYEEKKAKERDGSSSGEMGLVYQGQHQKWSKQICRHYCKKLGHGIRDCSERADSEKRKPWQGNKKPLPKGKSSGKSNSVGLIATHALTAKGPDQADSWILDSGATCHICSNQKLFDEIELKSSQEVTRGDG